MTWHARGEGVARSPDAPPSAYDVSGVRGIEIEIGGGIQSGGGDSPVQAPTLWFVNGMDTANANARGALLDPAGNALINQNFTPYSFDLFSFSARFGYRVRRNFSLGVFVSFAEYQVNDLADQGDAPDFTSRLSREQLTLGIYGRYYFTQFNRRFVPWLSAGVGFNYDAASYSRPIGSTTGTIGAQPETGDYILQQYGVVVPLAVGLDWRLAPAFSVGPTLGYARVFPLTGCVEVDVDQFSANPGQNTCSSPPVKNYGYDNFFGGIFVKLTFNPWAR